MTQKKGTGEVIAELDIGAMGTLKLVDDSHNDLDTYIRFINPDGEVYLQYGPTKLEYREQYDDIWVKAEFETARARGSSEPPVLNSGPFVCDGCHRTFASKRNQNPRGPKDICPDCAD